MTMAIRWRRLLPPTVGDFYDYLSARVV